MLHQESVDVWAEEWIRELLSDEDVLRRHYLIGPKASVTNRLGGVNPELLAATARLYWPPVGVGRLEVPGAALGTLDAGGRLIPVYAESSEKPRGAGYALGALSWSCDLVRVSWTVIPLV